VGRPVPGRRVRDGRVYGAGAVPSAAAYGQ